MYKQLLIFIFSFGSFFGMSGQSNLVIAGDFENTINPCDYRGEINTLVHPAGNPQTDIIQYVPDSNQLRKYPFCSSNYFSEEGWGCDVFSYPLAMPHDVGNDNFNYYMLFYHKNGSEYIAQEYAYFNLSETLEVGKKYKLSFWARLANEIDCEPLTLNIVGDDLAPCINGGITYLDGSTSSCGYTANVLDAQFPVTIDGGWKKYTFNLENLPDNINNLIFYPSIASNEGQQLHTMNLDDLIVYEIEYSNCLNENGEFSQVTPDCNASVRLFNALCVPNWTAANGSPDLCDSCFGVEAPTTNDDNYAQIGTYYSNFNGCKNEALFTELDLVAGQSYNLSFYQRIGSQHPLSSIDIKVYQTSSIPANTTSMGFMDCSALNIPSDAEIIYHNPEFINDEWKEINICFVAKDLPGSGLLFVPEQDENDASTAEYMYWMIDGVCLDETSTFCEPTTDLTACPSEGNYGFIAFDCPGDYFWEFEGGSMAQEFSSTDYSLIWQADPGVYTVSVEFGIGCEYEESFEIIEQCCNTPCFPPVELWCDYTSAGIEINWNEVVGASGYEIHFIPADVDCECEPGSSIIPDPITVTETSFNAIEYKCFSWTISTICGDGQVSAESDKMCFNPLFQDCFEP